MLSKIVSGGQTGVDRAALDVAQELGIPCGGWCPQGRRAEDGPIHERYPLVETPWSGYPQRTEWNVRDSDGTLIILDGEPDRGTRLTIERAARNKKPFLIVNLAEHPDPAAVHAWAAANGIEILNVAGPRASSCPAIYAQAAQFLRMVLVSSPDTSP
jgi:Circularly permutated YpsA SLOG family